VNARRWADNKTDGNEVQDNRLEVVPYDPGWPAAFEAEALRLGIALGTLALRIDHHGSTSIPGLGAKPIIDIQVSVAALQPLAAYGERLQAIYERRTLRSSAGRFDRDQGGGTGVPTLSLHRDRRKCSRPFPKANGCVLRTASDTPALRAGLQ
jgi:GrpB-like predicted nucleotidyltransferase (UPF0157 family)